MSFDLLLHTARDMWEREWAKASAEARHGCGGHSNVSPAMLSSLIDLVGEDPRRPAKQIEPVIQRMLFENSFVDDNGDSMLLEDAERVDAQARLLAKVLEDVRQMALRQGIWSGEPAAPMMFG